MTKRKSISRKARAEIFEANKGICCFCKGTIQIGEKWIVEHEIPFALGGSDDPKQLKITHDKCAKDKTVKDVADIAKAKRREAIHKGFKQPKQSIKSRGFDAAPKTKKRAILPELPRRNLYR